MRITESIPQIAASTRLEVCYYAKRDIAVGEEMLCLGAAFSARSLSCVLTNDEMVRQLTMLSL